MRCALLMVVIATARCTPPSSPVDAAAPTAHPPAFDPGPAHRRDASTSCDDRRQNGDETDVDCGGSCPPCPVGWACQGPEDCDSGLVCVGGACSFPSCFNGVADGDETGLDCGGSCPLCIGAICARGIDCASGLCHDHTCAVVSCQTGVRDGDETDIDCGGSCPPCQNGQRCGGAFDCASRYCGLGVCAVLPCANGVRDGHESDVDCGGSCGPCPVNWGCAVDADCTSGTCWIGACLDPHGPTWGPTATPADPPPPLSGGTLLVRADGRTAFAADPDRDAVFVVDLPSYTLLATVTLAAGDEPGRLVEDGAGRVHVALRGGGAVVDLDGRTFEVLARRAVCGAPRGIAWQAAGDRLHVACAGGELVSLPASGGAPVRTVHLGRDLRDVIVDGDSLHVSRFRTAELLTLDAQGVPTGSAVPPVFSDQQVRNFASFVPTMAWRAVGLVGGGAALVHQRVLTDDVPPGSGGYGDQLVERCDSSIVHAAVTTFQVGRGPSNSPAITMAVLPVDLAISPAGDRFAIIAAGNSRLPSAAQLVVGPLAGFGGCVAPEHQIAGAPFRQPEGQATAVAFDGAGEVVVQTREPATLQVLTEPGGTIQLSPRSREDTGHAIFHSSSGAGIACASCHGEGGDDGHVWQFAQLGARRTQSLRGRVLARAPFHWDGGMPDFATLVDAVFVSRMAGPRLSPAQLSALAKWVDAIPSLPAPPPADPAGVTRGAARFADPAVGCAGCHGGPLLSNLAIAGVGTGAVFKVPSLLGLGYRAPFLHNGCAPTLLDRFGPCGGGDAHGTTSMLGQGDLLDLVAYLETL